MKYIFTIAFLAFSLMAAWSQSASTVIRKGNELYKQKDYAGSLQQYNKALAAEPNNALANYNNGNALFRSGKGEEAVAAYDKTAEQSKDKSLQEKSLYNKGVALAKEKKLQESIDAWKQALKLNAEDNEARENLQKAMAELKKQQQQQQQNKPDKEQEKKQQKDKQQQQPKPQEQQSKLNKQQVEQLLRAMQQKEKEIQQKLQKGNPQTNRPEKDW